VAFGGQVALLSQAVTTAQISIQFLDAGNNAIGNAIVVPAGTSLNTWMRVFDTVVAPVGARSVEYLFGVAKSDGSNPGALLDGAFLGVAPQGVGTDQGVRTSADVIPGNSTLGRIATRRSAGSPRDCRSPPRPGARDGRCSKAGSRLRAARRWRRCPNRSWPNAARMCGWRSGPGA
jgi:hypothetical protein